MKPLPTKVISRMEEHDVHTIGILNASVKEQEKCARKRFDWSGREQITMKQTYTENEPMKLQKRIETLYHYENEGPMAPMVEEEKDLNDKQMSKLRKEREAEIKKNQTAITTAHKAMLKNPPDNLDLKPEIIREKLFTKPYTYETVHDFSPEAVRDNYIDSLKKLDEIINIAKMIKEYPSLATNTIVNEDEERKVPLKYDFEAFAIECQRVFENSLAVNGLKYEDGKLVKISYEKTQEASANQQKSRQRVINVFKKADFLYEKNTVQEVVDKIIDKWSLEDYFKCVDNTLLSTSLKQMHDVMKQSNNATIKELYEDYLRFINSILANNRAKELLMREMESPTEGGVFSQENYDYSGHIQDKIQEIDEYITKTEQEMNFIKELFDAMAGKKTLSEKQRLYLVEYYHVNDEEVQESYIEKLKSYCKIQVEYRWAPSYDDKFTLDATKEKIEELCPKLKSTMSKDDLLEIADDLYKVSEAIKRRFDQYTKTPSLRLKSQKIITYAKKARAVTLFHTSGWYRNIKGQLTDGEKEYIENVFGAINYETIAKYAKIAYAEADAMYINARRECINRPEVWKKLDEIKRSVNQDTVISHKNVHEKIEETKTKFGDKKNSLYNAFWSYYDLTDINNELLDKMQKETVKIPYSEVRDTLTAQSKHCQILSRLGDDTYKIFGDEQEIPLNMNTLKSLPGISDMNDEEYGDLLEKLSAGTLYETHVNAVEEESEKDINEDEFTRLLKERGGYKPPSSLAVLKAKDCFENDELKEEVREQFIKENKAGLQIIKEKMSEYFDMLYNKYGLEMLVLEQIIDNPETVVKDFLYCKECFKFIDCEALFDKSDDDDRLLINKIKFYGEMVNCFNTVIQLSQEENVHMGKIDFEIKRMWDVDMKEAAEYIKNNIK